MALDRVGVAVDRVGLVELGDADGEVGGELAEAGAALALPAGVELAPGHDAVGDTLEHEVETDRLDDARHRRAEVGERGLEVHRTARAGCVRRSATSMRSALMVRPASTGTGAFPAEKPQVRREWSGSSAAYGR